MSESRASDCQEARAERSLTLKLEGCTWETLCEEAAREGLTVEELITFSVLYYLADLDSGRIARRVSMSPYPGVADPQPQRSTRITGTPAPFEARNDGDKRRPSARDVEYRP